MYRRVGEGHLGERTSRNQNLSKSARAVGVEGCGLGGSKAELRRGQEGPLSKLNSLSFIQQRHLGRM